MSSTHKLTPFPARREDRANPKGVIAKKPKITLSDPFPFLDPGRYVARCTEATFAWARQWKKWIARLVLEPLDYHGRSFTGRLCKFLGLGKDPQRPHAGPQSHFRRLLVEVNGDQPTNNTAEVEIFVGVCYEIEVVTVNTDREGKPRPPEHWYSVVRGIHPISSDPTHPPSNTEPSNPLTLRTQTTHSTDQHSNTVNTPLGNPSTAELSESEIEAIFNEPDEFG